MRNDSASRVTLAILLSLLMTACSAEHREYKFGVSVVGGPEGWPVWVEDVIFDQSWSVPAGGIEYGFDQHPPRGGIAIINPKPAPNSVHARWFSYRTQTFYEVTFSLPDDLDAKLHRWYRDYPDENYRHYFVVGFSGKGEALAWWSAVCIICGYGRSHDFHTPLAEDIVADIVEGNPNRYDVRTREHVERGTIPPSPGMAHPQGAGDL